MPENLIHPFLPYGRHTIEDDDIAAVVEALKSDFLTTGPRVEQYEQAFASATGAKHAVACNSGTAALHLALMSIGLGPNEAAIVPSMTFLATANVVRMCGAEVVFADVDADTGLLTPGTLQDAIARARRAGLKVRAALPVHLNGQVCNLDGIGALAQREGIAIVEDACHALGVADIGASRHGGLACFSTHPVKAIATGEGGVVTTREARLAARMRALRSHGMVRDPVTLRNRELAFHDGQVNPWYYEMHEVGWNYRLPDILCALGLSQLCKLERFHAKRAALAASYDKLVAPLVPHIRPVPRRAAHGWHLYVVLVNFAALGIARATLMRRLRAQGVGTQVHYIPVHHQPYYRDRYGAIELRGADEYYKRCLSLPLFPALTDADLEWIVTQLSAAVRAH